MGLPPGREEREDKRPPDRQYLFPMCVSWQLLFFFGSLLPLSVESDGVLCVQLPSNQPKSMQAHNSKNKPLAVQPAAKTLLFQLFSLPFIFSAPSIVIKKRKRERACPSLPFSSFSTFTFPALSLHLFSFPLPPSSLASCHLPSALFFFEHNKRTAGHHHILSPQLAITTSYPHSCNTSSGFL